MNTRLFFYLNLIMCTLACAPIPGPAPEPVPEIIVQRDDFGFGTPEHFVLAHHTGNSSEFSAGFAILKADSGSGWIYTPESYLLPGLEIVTQVTFPDNPDFCLELSPELDVLAPNGFYDQPTRMRFYVYDPGLKFYVDYRNSDVSVVKQDALGAGTPTTRLRLRFTADSIYYDIFMDPLWRTCFAFKESWQGRWHIALSSAWKHGATLVDYVQIKGPKANFEARGNPEIFWDPNPELDLLGYFVHRLFVWTDTREAFFTKDTLLRFSNLPRGRYKFYVTAKDTAGNESAPSDTVSF